MNMNRFKWFGLVVLSLATMLVMGGCGGGGSSSSATVAKANISTTVNFPTSASVSLANLGKRVPKSVALALPDATIELRDLSGKLITSTTVAATVSGTYEYSFSNVPIGDYVVKAIRGNTVMKAIVDKGSLSADATRVRNVDTTSTTAVVVAEKSMGATLGTLGDVASAAVTTEKIATINPVALEGEIFTAIGAVTGSSAATATQANIDLVNLVNAVQVSVFSDVNPAAVIAGTQTLTVTTTQYTAANVATGGASTTISSSAITTTLAASVTAYTPPPADSVTFTSRVMNYSTSPAGVAVAGVEVTTNGLTTYTDASGYYTLAGIIKNTNFTVKMSKAGYVDSYSAQMTISANTNTSGRPFAMYTAANLTGWGNAAGSSIIRASVVESTNLDSGYMAGVVVKATDAADSTVYPVIYVNATTGVWDSTLTSTSTNGKWMFKNVPAGRTVNVTATKAGYTFNTRTFVTVADAVCQGRITGTVDPNAPVVTTNAVKASLQTGWYEFRQDSTSSNINYYSIQRIGLSTDGTTMTKSVVAYLDPVSKLWTTSKPSGYPVNTSNDYSLNTSGSWVVDNDGPGGYPIVFNADGSATVTSPADGSTLKAEVASVSIAGLANPVGPTLVSTATAYPVGSVVYNLSITNLTDSYNVWSSGSTLPASLAAIPAAYAENSTNYGSIYVETSSNTDYFYAKYVAGSTTQLNVYRGIYGSTTQPTLIGTATAATTTVRGQQILEITLPTTLRTTYGLTSNPIFAVVNGVVMNGTHSPAGFVDANKSGEGMFNDVAMNHLKDNVNTALLPKAAVAKKISKAVLGF